MLQPARSLGSLSGSPTKSRAGTPQIPGQTCRSHQSIEQRHSLPAARAAKVLVLKTLAKRTNPQTHAVARVPHPVLASHPARRRSYPAESVYTEAACRTSIRTATSLRPVPRSIASGSAAGRARRRWIWQAQSCRRQPALPPSLAFPVRVPDRRRSLSAGSGYTRRLIAPAPLRRSRRRDRRATCAVGSIAAVVT